MTIAQKVEVSWARVGIQINNLYKQIKRDKIKVDRIVGISRGGLPIGITLSHKFNVPFSVVGVSSYNDETCEQESLICDTPNVIFKGWSGNVIFCDDLTDSGATLKFLLDKVANNENIDRRITATIYYKETSIVKPDYYVEITSDWIVFPWE